MCNNQCHRLRLAVNRNHLSILHLLVALSACFAACAVEAMAQQPSPRSATPLEPSIICRGQRDYEQMSARIRRAAKLDCRRVNFVFTVNCAIDDDDQVVGYGLQRWESNLNRGRRSVLQPMDDELLARMTQYYKDGIAQARTNKMQIAILCHLDVATPPYAWRNYFRFDPVEKYAGYSYQDVLIDPLIEAIDELVPADEPVEIAIAGEMGQSVFGHADSYRRLVAQMREALSEKLLSIGISFNFNNVTGNRDPEDMRIFNKEQTQTVQQLLGECDFVGFSNYRAVSVPPVADDFRRSIDAFARDLQKNGVQLRSESRLHFSEIGLGGYGPDGFTTDPQQAAKSPYNGPGLEWKNPWQDEGMRAFRLAYHRALLKFLREQNATWPVEAAYLWSDSAWDPQGIDEGRNADRDIVEMIQAHNR